jgi:hypothetical protein
MQGRGFGQAGGDGLRLAARALFPAAAVILGACLVASPERAADTLSCQGKIYFLVKSIPEADFDYPLIEGIDSLPVPYPEGGVYQIGDIPTTAGKFTIHKFIAVYSGSSSRGGPADFHDLLAVKTDGQNRIQDAFQYTLEWADTPSLDLNRMQGAGLIMREGICVRELRLANARDNKEAGEDGVLHLRAGDAGSFRRPAGGLQEKPGCKQT